MKTTAPETNNEFVYVFADGDSFYVGYTSGADSRYKSHRRVGRTLVACWPGQQPDEQRLHDYLRRKGYRSDIHTENGSASHYHQDSALVAWLETLLQRGFATGSFAEAETIDVLPIEVWHPETLSTHAIEPDGQLRITAELPVQERLKLAAGLAQKHSFSDEWYTPADIIEPARETMGEIDLDPASCWTAQQVVNASTFYSRRTNGLSPQVPWQGRVWLNPPYGRGNHSAKFWIERLAKEYVAGNVTTAITVLNVDSTSAKWFETVWTTASAHGISRGRPNFWKPTENKSSPSKGVIYSFFGSDPARFLSNFAAICSHMWQVR